MTMTDHPQRERTQHDPAAHANQQHVAEQRQAAAHVGTAVADARSERTRARHLGADTRRLEDAGKILDAQINGREDMSVLRPGNALRHNAGGPEQGTGNLAAVAEFVHRVFIMGELPFDVLEDMHAARGDQRLAPAEQHAQETYRQAYRLENAAVVQPALPAGPLVPQSSNGVAQPRREPIAPALPPMFPPAPPESAAEQTGAMIGRHIEALRKDGHDVTAAEAAAARMNPRVEPCPTAPDFGPVPNPAFAASAVRIGDTQPMRMDEVLGHLPLDDAGAESAESGPRPFSGTGLSGDASPARDSGAGDD